MGVVQKDITFSGSWDGPDTSCQTCPSHLEIANDITVQDLDAHEPNPTMVPATLKTINGKRTLILG
jgi:hypothetical protein